MKTTDLIAESLLEVHKGDNWTGNNILEILSDVSWQGAVAQVLFTRNTIADITHHIAYWNRIVLQRARGLNPVVNEHNGFDAPVIRDDEAWEELKADVQRSAEELAAVIRAFDETKLFEPLTPGGDSAYKNFRGQVEHANYHLGQIMMLRRYVKSQP